MRWRPTFPRLTIFTNINTHYAGHPLRILSAAVKTIFFTHLYVQYGPFPSGTYGASMLPTLEVPEGHCWVVGDNLPYSRDSRHYGPFPIALVRGKVIAKVFPWSERKWIGNGLEPVH
ncbi:signal peptidase [Diplocarpon rosae]|nr:signal peptidase [Diplocarpon rosae]